MSDVVVVGSLNMDMVVSVPHIPKIGETILATDIQYYGGGKGSNQAIAAARLGCKVSMIGKVGNDNNGEHLIQSLKSEGINTEGVEISNNISGTAFINVSLDGDNNIVVYPGANNDIDIEQIERYREIIENSKICILQMEIPYKVVKYVINLCYEKEVQVVFNPAPATKEIEDELINKINILIPNETELSFLSDEKTLAKDNIEQIAKKTYEKGCTHLIVTLGSKGSLYLSKGGSKYFSSKKTKVVDSTAAGDSFIGALVTGIIQGKSIDDAMEYASYAASLTVSKSGAQSSLPTKKEVEKFIKSYK
ncbi:ribokinase [Senegalia massiliensis]|uniref:ribokinase n=1 Tax=Senegalia massiliensis TaxID=1720316 RepID=UPI0010302936|nr:ribokinase [Senegalia massiliensis]